MQSHLSDRKYVIGAIFIVIALVMVFRLFYLQVIDTSFRISADNNSQRYEVQYPARGLIFDRKGNLMVDNVAAYDLMVIPQLVKTIDTVEICSILNITPKQFVEELRKAREYSVYKPTAIVKQLSSKSYAILQEKLYKYPGFSVQTRTLRKYPSPIASHLLGYVGEVDEKQIERDSTYKSGDNIGISGIEKTYEDYLRGTKGVKIYLVDVHNRVKGSYKDGAYDEASVSGSDVTTTLDKTLQEYGETLMQNKIGSIVAIEPSTGEILTLISSPSYNPNLLVGRERTVNYRQLSSDAFKPLFNRALMAKYPPGSTFKLMNALIALQEGIITPQTRFTCAGGYHVGSFTIACHHNTSMDMIASIQLSCNTYYCNVFRKILDDRKFGTVTNSFINWRRHLTSFGLGHRLNSDIPNELDGNIPTAEYYNKYYGEGRWKSLMLVSMSIGQGELGITPFQMANMTAAIANRGYYYTPHIIKKIKGSPENNEFTQKHFTTIEPKYFEPVIDGMELVVKSGTAMAANLSDIAICGKTGTAENPHGEDHSIFIAFAPKDNPKIAIAVVVENGGFGATWAAPIASLMIEKYLKGKIARHEMEKRMMECNLLDRVNKPKDAKKSKKKSKKQPHVD